MTHRSVQKLAFKTAAYAFAAWRAAAAARKARRTALVRFMRRRNQNIASEIFAAWESVVAERKHAEEELKRCLIRKRMAFKQFKQWYWDSFDEDLQVTKGWKKYCFFFQTMYTIYKNNADKLFLYFCVCYRVR